MVKEFWKAWKNKSNLELNAIDTIKKARQTLTQNLPKNEILLILVKGSFPRREMNKQSDVDLVTIVKSTKSLKKLRQVDKKHCDDFIMHVDFGGYSLWELQKGRRSKDKSLQKSGQTGISRILKQIDSYPVIYGKKLDFSKSPRRTDEKDFKIMLSVFRNIFIPNFKNKKIGFTDLIKQVFWLTENEYRFKGIILPHSWKEMSKKIRNKNHLFHLAYYYRKNPTKDKKLRNEFISKLKMHLDQLEKQRK